MSDFPYQPSYPFDRDMEPRVLLTKFGDGYEQRAGDGINLTPQIWNLSFNNKTLAELTAIEDFFKLKSAIDAFTWTPPNGTEIKVICRKWKATYQDYGINAIGATFEQVFE